MGGMLDQAYQQDFKTRKRESNGAKVGSSSSPITKNRYVKAEVVSALQKMIRRGMEPEALYWASELLESGEEYTFWRRIFAITAEDIGLGDPDMPQRIHALYRMASVCKEWNIPFMAVALLCRSQKNREMDDAAWMYEMRRKEGWKIPIPAVARDGHTRDGKTRLYAIARANNESFDRTWAREFYYDAALLKGYKPVIDPNDESGQEDRYRHALMDLPEYRLPYETYELADCPQPRILTGGEAYNDVLASRAPEEIQFRPLIDEATGEIIDADRYQVKSFTSEEIYEVNLREETCTCPAYRSSERACKHVIGLDRQINGQPGQ